MGALVGCVGCESPWTLLEAHLGKDSSMNPGKIVAMLRCAVQCGWINAAKMYSPSFSAPRLARLHLKSLRQPLWASKAEFDELIFREVILMGAYDHACIRSMKDVKFIIDAGAHVGLATAQFASWFPEAQIVSIEPDASNLAVLRKNASMYPNVTVLHGALWSHESQLRIANPDSNSTGFRVQETESGPLTGFSLPGLMQRFGMDSIDILKMDIEGSEKEIFEASTTEWLNHTRLICIELHDWLRAGCAHAFYSKLILRDFNQYQPPSGLVDIIQFV